MASCEPLPGSESPSASVRQFIELAVNMPEHEPQVGHAERSIAATSSSLIRSSAAATIASTRSSACSLPWSTTLPASIGPPETNTTGMLIRSAAISPDRYWLAVAGEFTGRSPAGANRPWEDKVEVLDLRGLRAGRDPETCRHYIKLPEPEEKDRHRHIARTVAFADRGELLAVGMDEMPRIAEEADNFFRLTGGKVHVFRTATGKRVTPAAGLSDRS